MGDAYGMPDQLAEAMAAAKCRGGAVTEHGNAYSWVKWNKACKSAGIKPVFGVEHYITEDHTCRDSPPRKADGLEVWRNHHNRRYHITTLALDDAGWADTMRMLSIAHDKARGYWYKPRIDWKLLAHYGQHLVATSGCMSSYSSQRLLGDQWDKAEAYCKKMADVFSDRWYLEVQPNFFEGQELINKFCYTMHLKHGWPLLATNDIHYPKRADHPKRTFLLKQNGMDNYDPLGTLFVLAPKQIRRMFRSQDGRDFTRLFEQAIDNSNELLDRCNCKPPTAPGVVFPLPTGFKSPTLFLKHLCKEGWQRHGLPLTRLYTKRIEREIRILEEKDFINQILVVWSIMDFCHRNNIMVGARGSAAGSLVCFLIRITDLDPLKFDLLFERFVDITRNDPPDIDVDIQHNRRHEVKIFLRDTYGDARVGDICTFSQYRSRSALDALAAEHGIPMNEVNVIKNMLVDKDNDMVGSTQKNMSLIIPTVERHPPAKEVWDKYPQLHMAADLDGMIRHTSKHAGGVIVGTGDLELTDVCFFNQDGVWGLDKKDSESLGFLKIDALGLITMSCLAESRDSIKELHGKDIDFHELPLDDTETLEGFREVDLQGVFQFEGRTARLITMRVQPQDFDEIIDINALCRPGPMYGGATEEYVKAGHGGKAEDWPHEILDRITEKTRGTLLYQEQMLQIMKDMGGMTWKDVTFARRCISKRLGLQEMGKLRDRFIKGSAKKGLNEEDANWVWDRMVTFGTYAFNKSHAAAYGRVGYWCMWVKRHYPEIFYTSFGMHTSNEHKQRRLLMEYLVRGGKLLPPDINTSGLSFTLEAGGIRPGLADIKFIGEKCAKAIVQGRPYNPPQSIIEQLPRRVLNKRSRQALIDLGSLPGSKTMNGEDAKGFYYPWYMPGGLDEWRMPSFVRCEDCMGLKNLEFCSIVGRVATRWNNTYEDKKHRITGGAAELQYGQVEGRVTTYKIELEDETGEVFVAFRKHYPANARILRDVKPGDYIIVEGVWVGDYERISGRTIQVVRKKADIKRKPFVPEELFS